MNQDSRDPVRALSATCHFHSLRFTETLKFRLLTVVVFPWFVIDSSRPDLASSSPTGGFRNKPDCENVVCRDWPGSTQREHKAAPVGPWPVGCIGELDSFPHLSVKPEGESVQPSGFPNPEGYGGFKSAARFFFRKFVHIEIP